MSSSVEWRKAGESPLIHVRYHSYLGKPSRNTTSRTGNVPGTSRRSSARLRGLAANDTLQGAGSGSTIRANVTNGPYPRDGSWRNLKRDRAAAGAVDERIVTSSPTPMDVDQEEADGTAEATFGEDDTFTINDLEKGDDGPDSIIHLESYTGEVAIGLYGHEGEEEFLVHVPGFGIGKGVGGSRPGMGRRNGTSFGASSMKGKGKGKGGGVAEEIADVVAKGKGKGKEVMKRGMRMFGA